MAEAAPLVTIDGPAGAGKGTVAQRLAQRLGWHYLDSGALYRVLALAVLRDGLPAQDDERLVRRARTLAVEFRPQAQGYRLHLDGLPVGDELRTEACAAMASEVASRPPVRTALLELQRRQWRAPGLVAEGRDMGTVVFPQAPLKVFLTADAGERARRRVEQLRGQGVSANLEVISDDLRARDRRDRERSTAPLRPAADAIVIDSTGVSVEAVMDRLMALCRARLGRGVAVS